MSPEVAEARRLLKTAQSDLRALETLAADPRQENDVLGFHAQQAVEKSLKAVLAATGTEIPYTHDLSFLLDVTAARHVAPPPLVAQAEWLTPWAVAARYGTTKGPLDREAALRAAAEAVTWAAERISSSGS